MRPPPPRSSLVCVQGNHHFIRAVVPHLTPVLLKQLTRQEETPEVDDTAWNMAMAAGTCLGLMARVAKDAVTPHVLPFVQENIAKAAAPEDWRFREAATFAFGSILEGPEPASLIEVVRQAMDFLLRVSRSMGQGWCVGCRVWRYTGTCWGVLCLLLGMWPC